MKQATPDIPARQHLVPILLSLATIALALRLLQLVDAHAVDLMYWDQLDFFEIFKTDASLWDVFRYQHGPHRQGLPFVGTALLAEISDWNIRADAFYVAGYILAATLLALALRRRLFGPFDLSDVAIPLLFLTPAQYGIFIHTTNASHGAGPLFLLMLYCLALTLPDRRWRYGLIVALDFVMVHTGFAIFVGAITPLLFALFAWKDARHSGRQAAALPLAGLALSLAWIAAFLVHYTSVGGLDAMTGTDRLSLYPQYLAYMFANVLGLKSRDAVTIAAGGIVAVAVTAVAIRQAVVLLRAQGEPPARAAVVCSLCTFTVLYCVTTAAGRVHLGLPGAQSTRYVPLIVPGFLGLYLAIRSLERKTIRIGLSWVAVVAMIAATFPMREPEARFMAKLSRGKRIWVANYLETGDITAANRAARLRVYPFRDPKHRTAEKFEYLRAHRLSFFSGTPEFADDPEPSP